jgi:predicted nucleic acid-binding protein
MTSADDSPLFLDTNILVYANAAAAPQHQMALEAIRRHDALGATLWISRQVLREFLAVVTRPQSFAAPLAGPLAVARVRYFATHFQVAEETAAVADRLLSLVETLPIGGVQIHDANIVATMQEYGIGRILTNNAKDFARFAHLIDVLTL